MSLRSPDVLQGRLRFVQPPARPLTRWIPAEEWEQHKKTIIELYKGQKMTLGDAMEHMERYHDFEATRRQYVHQFAKWGIHKYRRRITHCHGCCQRSLEDEDGDPPESLSQQSLSPIDGTNLSSTTCQSSSSSTRGSLCSSDAMDNEDDASEGRKMDLNTGTSRSLLPPPAPHQLRAFAMHQLWTAADFLFAVSDDHASFKLYQRLFYTNGPASPSQGYSGTTCRRRVRNSLAIASARSAETPDDAAAARDILLDLTRESEAVGEGLGLDFLHQMLTAYTFHRMADQMHAGKLLQGAIDAVVADGDLGLSRRSSVGGCDLITYQLLHFGLSKYQAAEHLGRRRTLDVDGLLDQLLEDQQPQQTRRTRGLQGGDQAWLPPAVKACLAWVARELNKSPEVPAILQRIPCPTDKVRRWKDGYALFGTLWARWQQQQQHSSASSSPSIAWAETAEEQLALRPTELLCTTCWLVVGHMPPPPTPPGAAPLAQLQDQDRQPVPEPAEHAEKKEGKEEQEGEDLVRRAQAGARAVLALDAARFRRGFLHTFECINDLVAPGDEDLAFRAGALPRLRQHVWAALGGVEPPLDEAGDAASGE